MICLVKITLVEVVKSIFTCIVACTGKGQFEWNELQLRLHSLFVQLMLIIFHILIGLRVV